MKRIFFLAALIVAISCVFAAADPTACNFIRGDANGDGTLGLPDASYIGNWYGSGGPDPTPTMDAGDANDDGVVNISDISYITNWWLGGPNPSSPYSGDCIEGSSNTIDSDECGTNYPLGSSYTLTQGTCSFTEESTTGSVDFISTPTGSGHATLSLLKEVTCSQSIGADCQGEYSFKMPITMNALKLGELEGLDDAGNTTWELQTRFTSYIDLYLEDRCKHCWYNYQGEPKNDNCHSVWAECEVWLEVDVNGTKYSILATENGEDNLHEGGSPFSDLPNRLVAPVWQRDYECDCDAATGWYHFIADPKTMSGYPYNNMDYSDWFDFWDYHSSRTFQDKGMTCYYTCSQDIDPLEYSTQDETTQEITWSLADIVAGITGSHSMDDEVKFDFIEFREMFWDMDLHQDSFYDDFPNYEYNLIEHTIWCNYLYLDATQCPGS